MSAATKKNKLIADAVLTLLIILAFALDLFSYLEFKLGDRIYQRPTSVNPDIIVIGIDEAAVAMFDQTNHWSRQIMADAINILNSSEEYKPAVIALDIIYAGESADKDADANLAKAAQEGGNVVLAASAMIGQVLSPDESGLVRVVRGYETPYPALAQHARYGFVGAVMDDDSVIRNAAIKLEYGDDEIYSFPYEIYRKYMGDFADASISEYSEIFLTYSDVPGEYKQLSFADIFDEDFDPEYYWDCIVLIGAFVPASMDSYFTPMSQTEQMYGVEIHANAVQMLLEGNFKRHVPDWVNFVILFAFVILAMVLAKYVDIRVLLAILAALSIGYFFAALQMFKRGYILFLIYPVAAMALIYIYQLVYSYILESLEKRKVKDAFKKYVDTNLVDKLMESGEADSNEVGVDKDIAVLFVDVRGFTPMTEALKDDPGQVVKILNEYLELTTNSVFKNGGSVDKFIGDATMALFNGFFPLEDHVYKAVKAAWDMVAGAAEVNASIKEKYDVDLGFGVGINCGRAIVGNLGPSFRKDYTAIGDTVNTAARLESNAKPSQVLITKDVYDAVKDRVMAESIGEIPLKGKTIGTEVFSVTSVS